MIINNHIITTSSFEFGNRLDAELYRPNLKESFNELFKTGYEILPLKRFCIIRSGTTPPDRIDGLEDGPILFKTTDVRNGVISPTGDYYHISERIHRRMSKTQLKKHDVLLNIVGATLDVIGRAGFIDNLPNEANITQAMVFLRCKTPDIIPSYLFSYLKTKYGQDQIKRFARPTGQYNLNLQEVRQISVPVVPKSHQIEIEDLVLSAAHLQEISEEKYIEAETLLKQDLGDENLKYQEAMSYTARFSEIDLSRRSDAEFFHVRYNSFLDAVHNYREGYSPLGQITNRILPNFDARKNFGEFDYIEIGDICTSDGSYSKNRMDAKALPANAKIKLTGGEILISEVRPTRGAISIIEYDLSHPTICSGAFYTCLANEPKNREIIWLYLRIMRGVFEKYCGGTSYPTIESHYIRKFPVPNFDKDLAHKIGDLILRSQNEKRESEKLLNQAKDGVEEFIDISAESKAS